MPRPTLGLLSAALLTLALAACQPTSSGTSATSATAPSSSVSTAAQAVADPAQTAAAQENSGGPSSASAPSQSATDGALHQVAGITDGDTIKVWVGDTKETIRLLGVDTPESKKPHTAVACYAKEATSKMQSLVQSKQVYLVADPTQADRDRYGRLVRYVVLPDGTDVSEQLIAGGFGREYTYAAAYAKQGAFRAAQTQAQAAKRGLWGACTYAAAFNPPTTQATQASPSSTSSAPFVAPPATTSDEPQGACRIKGNINSKGEKIYHLPGQRNYDITVITPSRGERWFCTEQEAVAAGWRKSKV